MREVAVSDGSFALFSDSGSIQENAVLCSRVVSPCTGLAFGLIEKSRTHETNAYGRWYQVFRHEKGRFGMMNPRL